MQKQNVEQQFTIFVDESGNIKILVDESKWTAVVL